MTRSGTRLAHLALGMTAWCAAAAEAAQVRLDFKTSVGGPPWVFFSGYSDAADYRYPSTLPAPDALTDLLPNDGTVHAFVEYDTAAPPGSTSPERNVYTGRAGLFISGNGQSQGAHDSSANIIESAGSFPDFTQQLITVSGDPSASLRVAMQAGITQEVEYSTWLLGMVGGAPQSVPSIRLRISYDTLNLDSVSFGLALPATNNPYDSQLPSLDTLAANPASGAFMTLRWIADARFELMDSGFSNADDYAAMSTWLQANFTAPRVYATYSFSSVAVGVSAVPEPASALMWLGGIALLLSASRRQAGKERNNERPSTGTRSVAG